MSWALALIAAAAPAAVWAQNQDRERAAFRAEIERPGPQWVVVSKHFRHTVRCAAGGCVLMGPTDDKGACEEWSKLYNSADVYDHSRCVPAEPFLKETR